MWKQWKSIKKKERELIALGCDPDKAHSYACARQKYMRCSCTFLNRFIRISVLKSMGLQAVEEVLAIAAVKFNG
ncbi:hypothetical protein [uncultured Faecalibaculum sp.]|uniref:hypothetical protein n=1 Tax=uncultured Faecalibaculum sp. TaxID=1729681 RepID=UPI00262E1259|nr:hypothetical protein [uncultured Faecalibaculum sp.]